MRFLRLLLPVAGAEQKGRRARRAANSLQQGQTEFRDSGLGIDGSTWRFLQIRVPGVSKRSVTPEL